MKRGFILAVILLAALSVTVIAEDFSFLKYTGETHWSVAVTENEEDCGGSNSIRSTHNIVIKHNQADVVVGDYGHGTHEGLFVAPLLLRMPAIGIKDGSGHSTLDSFDAVFTDDCQHFSAEYVWEYTDEYQFCSGSTRLEGTRTDGAGCPKSGTPNFEMTPRETTPTETQQTADTAPNDFWKNWNAAEEAKKKGNYDDFIKYFDNAINNPSIAVETREEMKKQALKDLHLSSFPTKTTSPILRIEANEVDDWNGGWIYNVNVPAEKKGILDILLWNIHTPSGNDLINRVVGVEQ